MILWYCYCLTIYIITYLKILSNAQQSCVPATALKRKVAKLQFCLSVYLSVLFCLSVYLSISSFQKSIQNDSKILPNRSQNGQKSRSGGSLGLLCGVSSPQGACGSLPGQLLGGSRRCILCACWVAPGPSWAPGWGVQGRLEGSLEASWGKFNAKMEPSWH